MSERVTDTLDLYGQEKDSMVVAFEVRDTDSDGVSQLRDLTDWTFISCIRNGPTKSATKSAVNFTVTKDPDKRGLVRATLAKDHSLAAGDWYYEIDMTTTTQRETALEGKLIIAPSLFNRG